MKLRGNRFGIRYSPKVVLENITIIAENIGVHGKLSVYVLQGGSNLEVIDGFLSFFKMIARAVKYMKLPAFYISSCGAKRVVFNNNIIAFYPKHARIIKLFGNEQAHARHLQGVGAFQKSNPTNIRVPKIVQAGECPINYVVETLQNGISLNRPVDLSGPQIKDLVRFHMGSARVVIVDFPSSLILKGEKGILFDLLCPRVRPLIEVVLNRSAYASVHGATHGDLTAGNMLLVGGAPVLFDWEGYGESSVAFDLVKIWLQSSPATRDRIIVEYNSAQKLYFPERMVEVQPDSMQLSLLIAMLIKLIDTEKLYDYLLARDGSAEKAKLGVSKSQAVILEGISYLVRSME